VRFSDRILITPSGVPYPDLAPRELVEMSFTGAAEGRLRPSSEWRFHVDIYRARPEVGAIVHLHAAYASAYSSLRRDLPPFHYMIAVAGGSSIRCAPYATFGTQQLSDQTVAALQDRKACLLANHGIVAIGDTPEDAGRLAVEVETLCEMYTHALQAGSPVILTEAEMAEVLARFTDYGNPDRSFRSD
jgi:L-fuculose-phosphate aldolase